MTTWPSLPGFAFHAVHNAGPWPAHEIGWTRLSEDALALWATRMSSRDRRSELVNQLHSALSIDAPAAALKGLNEVLCTADPDASSCAEFVMMVLNRANHTLTVSAAGDFLPVLRTPDNQIVVLDRSRVGVPLGMVPSFEYVTQIVSLSPQTSVVWLSPYTMQIQNSSGQLYGFDRFRKQLVLALHDPASTVESITHDILQFIGNRDQCDDICILCVQRTD